MRYQSFTSFQKQLQSSAPSHLSRFYLLLSSDDYERKKATEAVLSFLPKEGVMYFKEEFSFDELVQELSSVNLFSSCTSIVVDWTKEIKKKEIDALLNHLPHFSGHILFGSTGKQGLTSLYRFIDKEGVIFDLTEEKKWEKEKRLKEAVSERVSQAKKTMAKDALDELFARVQPDLALLENEIDKLICYSDKNSIRKEDVEKLSSVSASFSFWQIAEKIVWEGTQLPAEALLEIPFPALFSPLRTELRNGLIMKELMAKGLPWEEISGFFPGMWPKALEKRRDLIKFLPLSYFQKGLMMLFEVELSLKDGLNCGEILLDFFTHRLHRNSV